MAKVRLLVDQHVDSVPVAANAVLDLSDELTDPMVALGHADPDPEAVAYAETLGVEVPPLPEQPEPDPPEGRHTPETLHEAPDPPRETRAQLSLDPPSDPPVGRRGRS